MLEMSSFEDGDLDILKPGLFSARLNLSPYCVSQWKYFAEAQSQYLGLCAAHDNCDWFREKQTSETFFPLHQNVNVWSQTFPQRWVLRTEIWLGETQRGETARLVQFNAKKETPSKISAPAY